MRVCREGGGYVGRDEGMEGGRRVGKRKGKRQKRNSKPPFLPRPFAAFHNTQSSKLLTYQQGS